MCILKHVNEHQIMACVLCMWTLGAATAVLPDDITQLDSNSLFVASSNTNTFLIPDSISFPLSSMSEPLVVQALPLTEVCLLFLL